MFVFAVLIASLFGTTGFSQERRTEFEGRVAVDYLLELFDVKSQPFEAEGSNPQGDACEFNLAYDEGVLSVQVGGLGAVDIELGEQRSFYGYATDALGLFVYFVNDKQSSWTIPGQYGDGYRLMVESNETNGRYGTWVHLRKTRSDDLMWKIIYEESCFLVDW